MVMFRTVRLSLSCYITAKKKKKTARHFFWRTIKTFYGQDWTTPSSCSLLFFFFLCARAVTPRRRSFLSLIMPCIIPLCADFHWFRLVLSREKRCLPLIHQLNEEIADPLSLSLYLPILTCSFRTRRRGERFSYMAHVRVCSLFGFFLSSSSSFCFLHIINFPFSSLDKWKERGEKEGESESIHTSLEGQSDDDISSLCSAVSFDFAFSAAGLSKVW